MTPEYKRLKLMLSVVALLLLLYFTARLSYSVGERDERSESTQVAMLIARADSNIVALQQVAKADSTKANDAGLNIIYWQGVRHAYGALDEDEVRVKKSALGRVQ